MVTISTRIRQLRQVLAIAERLRQRVLLGRHASAQRRTRSWTSRSRRSCGWRSIRRSWRSARPGSTTHYDNSSRRGAGRGLPQPHRGGAGDRAAAGDPRARRRRRHARASSRRRCRGGRSRPCCTASRAGRSWPCARVELGLYVSFSGVLTFKKSEALREIASDVPLDRLLVETDAPYLAPEQISRQDATSRPTWPHTARDAGRGQGHLARPSWPRRRPTTSSACSRQDAAGTAALPPHEHCAHDPGLRLLGRRAAHRQRCGAPAIRPIRRTAAAAARCWSSASASSGSTTVLVDTPPDLREQLLSVRVRARSTACSTRTTTPTTRTASTTCAWCPTP